MAHLDNNGMTIHKQCEDLGLDPRKLWAECPHDHESGHHVSKVQDIEEIRKLSPYNDMEQYQEAITNAIILTRAAHSNCGFYLPAYVINIHLRRLKRLDKAIKKHIDNEFTVTDSTDSEGSNKFSPYPTARPETKRRSPQRRKPAPARDNHRTKKRQRSPPNKQDRQPRRRSKSPAKPDTSRRKSPPSSYSSNVYPPHTRYTGTTPHSRYTRGHNQPRSHTYTSEPSRQSAHQRNQTVHSRHQQEIPLRERSSSSGQGRGQ